MTPEEKIEALRKWLETADYTRLDIDDWKRGFLDAQRGVRNIIDPPKPKWREMVDEHETIPATDPNCPPQYALSEILFALHRIADERPESNYLAQIVAICEAQVGDGWQADPERVHPGFWGVAWLLVPLSHEPPDWAVVGDRAAAWLRSLTDGGAE